MLYCSAGWLWFILNVLIYSFMFSINVELSGIGILKDLGVGPTVQPGWSTWASCTTLPLWSLLQHTVTLLSSYMGDWGLAPFFIIVKPDCGILLLSVISRQGPWFLLLNACLTQVQLNARLFIYLFIFAVKSGIYRKKKYATVKRHHDQSKL